MRKKSELLFALTLVPVDFLAIIGAFVTAYIIRVKVDARPVAVHLEPMLFVKIFLLIVPVWILIFALTDLYNLSVRRARLEEIGKIFVAVSGGTMFIILVDFVLINPIFPSRAIPIYGYGLSFLFVTIARQILQSIRRRLYKYKIGTRNVVLVGGGRIAGRLAKDLLDPASGYQLAAVLDKGLSVTELPKSIKVYDNAEELFARVKNIDEIIQADTTLSQSEITRLVAYAQSRHIAYKFVPNQFGIYATNSGVTMMAGQPLIEIRRTPLDGWGRIFKRAFDLLGSGLGLILLSPILIIIALLIKLTDPGTVFYRQQRLSRQGKKINIYKFRTMYWKYCTGEGYPQRNDAVAFERLGKPELIEEFGRENKLKDDPRISPLGRFLRKTSLDELPQLINVLIGDLSLVGPRPMLESELKRFGEHLPAVLALRCGITGLWQVSGRSDIGFKGRVKLDLYYVENWSIWLDVRILLKTLLIVLKGRGAY